MHEYHFLIIIVTSGAFVVFLKDQGTEYVKWHFTGKHRLQARIKTIENRQYPPSGFEYTWPETFKSIQKWGFQDTAGFNPTNYQGHI